LSRHILDELVRAETRDELRRKRISAVQVGKGWGQSGWDDEEQLLPHLRGSRCTFHTQDEGFFKRRHRHRTYCIVCYVNITPERLSSWIVRFLRHREFNTHAKRLGRVIKVTPERIEYWEMGHEEKSLVEW
jgi:hypothetical protein